MAEIILKAATGRPTGSRTSGRLRAEGKVPGVVYGLGKDPVPMSVEWRELRAVLTGAAGLNTLIDLEIEGEHELVMVKELQRHPIRRNVLHVDLLRVDRNVEITVDVPVVLHGEAEEVLREGGVVEQVLHTLSITSKPGAVPNEIAVDISGLRLGDSIRVGDVALPAGAISHADPEEPLVVAAGTAAGAAAAAEEAEEGAEAEPEEGAGEAEAASDEGAAAEGDAE